MKKNIHEMMRARIQSEKLNIEHMREPCQGMPVRGMCCAKRPIESLKRNPFFYMLVIKDVIIIIKVHKVMIRYPVVGGENGEDEKDNNKQEFSV